ncbi:MAG: SDR family oxidoreductase, partial [Candidatus Bathyarchaeota archaeon]|nr:SDR family oxidoreductase [Candidatus Bathyarchaeota archaeon]
MGEAVAKKLADNGAFVYVTDINLGGIKRVAQEILGNGGMAKAVPLDVTDYKQVTKLIGEILKEDDKIDILVNNAGILRRRPSIADIPEEEWDLVMNVNVKGVFNCSKAALPTMKERRYGKIVIKSSTAGRSTSELGGAA